MALAATRIMTAMATGLLATAATSFSGDGPSPEQAPQIRPYVQASSTVNVGVFATLNGLLAAAAEAPAADSFARSGTFTPNTSVATDPILTARGTGGAVVSGRNLFVAMPIHSAGAGIGSHRLPTPSLATPALLTSGGGIGNAAAMPSAAGVGSLGALIAVFISNGTPEHPDAGLLIGNGADGGPGQDGGNAGCCSATAAGAVMELPPSTAAVPAMAATPGWSVTAAMAATAATSPPRTTSSPLAVTGAMAATAAGC